MSMEIITSRKNPLLQHVRKLLSSRSYRQEQGQFAADGVKLLEEAVKWIPQQLHTVLVTEKAAICALPEHVRLVQIPEDVMEQISPMQTPQGALFVCRLPQTGEPRLQPGTVVLDGIQDPGNLGTILRTADALGVPVALLEGCADPYNHKVVRASMGAVFRTPVVTTTWQAVREACAEAQIPVAVTALTDRAKDLRQADLGQMAVVIGSEGQGVRPQILAEADAELIIPMEPGCESLNAAVAATIVMWQMKR